MTFVIYRYNLKVMSIFDRVDGTPINGYNLVEAGFEQLAHYDASSSSYAVDRSGSYQFYYQKPVIINKTLIGFAKYENGKFDISDHLMGYKNFEYKVDSIEDIMDIINMHSKKMLEEYLEMDKPNYFNFKFPLNY
jgi:hypothetical protein